MARALTPAAFSLTGDLPFVVLKTLKQRQRTKGRPKKNEAVRRAVSLTAPQCVRLLTRGFNEPNAGFMLQVS